MTGDIPDLSQVTPSKKIEPIDTSTPGKGENIGNAGQPAPFNLEPAGAAPQAAGAVNAPSPMEVAGQTMTGTPTSEQVSQNMQQLVQQLEGVKNQLQTTPLQLNSSQQQVMQYRLNRFQEHVHSLADKVGVSAPPPGPATGAPSQAGSVVSTYLSYLTSGQSLLQQSMQQLNAGSAGGKQLSPSDLLAVQLKVNTAQQDIQFFSSFLGSSLDALKQTMNINM